MKTLLAYYSRAGENWVDGKKQFIEVGNTKIVVSYIQKIMDSTSFQIVEKDSYPIDYEECCKKAFEDIKTQNRPELKQDFAIEEYQRIFLCFPIYYESCPMAVLSFLKNKDFTSKDVYLISTHEGSGMGISKSMIEKENSTIKIKDSLPIIGSLSKKSEDIIVKFLHKII